jgi:hypothetical protein
MADFHMYEIPCAQAGCEASGTRLAIPVSSLAGFVWLPSGRHLTVVTVAFCTED